MLRALLSVLLFMLLVGCIEKVPRELKSPCVANDRLFGTPVAPGPCERRKPIDNWLV
jgi:hypothetical protein